MLNTTCRRFITRKTKYSFILASLVGKKLNYKVKDDENDPLEPVIDYMYDETNEPIK